MINNSLENEYASFELKDGILIGAFKKEIVDLESSLKITADRMLVQKGEAYPIVSNIKNVKIVTKEARRYLASEDGCVGVTAAAVLIDSYLGSMIGNFFIKINKPLRPTRIFTNENEAKLWLKQFIQKEF